jgi:hypothetical protein
MYNRQLILFWKRLNDESSVFRDQLVHVSWNGVLWAVEEVSPLFPPYHCPIYCQVKNVSFTCHCTLSRILISNPDIFLHQNILHVRTYCLNFTASPFISILTSFTDPQCHDLASVYVHKVLTKLCKRKRSEEKLLRRCSMFVFLNTKCSLP